MPEQWQDLLETLRKSQFIDLARLIEDHIAAGKSIAVEERKARGKRPQFEPIRYFEVLETSEVKRQVAKYDLQVVPYTDDEKEQIVLTALKTQFISPRHLITPLAEKLGGLSIGFASPIESNERVLLDEYERFFDKAEVKELDHSIAEHVRKQ